MNLNQQLLGAVRQNNAPACLDLLARGADVHAVDKGGWTALHWAAWRGFTETCQLLLEHGVDVHRLGAFDRSALHLAASRGETPACLRLLDHGASWLLKDKNGRTAVEEAMVNGKDDCASAIRSSIAARAARSALQEIGAASALKRS